MTQTTVIIGQNRTDSLHSATTVFPGAPLSQNSLEYWYHSYGWTLRIDKEHRVGKRITRMLNYANSDVAPWHMKWKLLTEYVEHQLVRHMTPRQYAEFSQHVHDETFASGAKHQQKVLRAAFGMRG